MLPNGFLKQVLQSLIAIVFIVWLFPVITHALPGDLNSSGRVDGYDLILFGRANGSSTGDANWNPDADLDESGTIDQADLDILSIHFGNTGLTFGLWVGDQYSGTERVAKLSSTGNFLKRVGSFNSPVSLSSNLVDGAVWVADSGNDQVIKLDNFDGARLLTISGMDPYSISVNSQDGSVWVADYANNRVVKLLPDIPDGYTIGIDSGSHIAINGFSNPRSVSVNPVTGIIWVADSGNSQVVKLSPDVTNGYDIGVDTGKHVAKGGFTPYSVSVNVADGTVWVADYYGDQVVKLSSTGGTELLRINGFNAPVALDTNSFDGSVWIADYTNHEVVRLAADGSLIFRVGGFRYPSAVAVNPLEGSCWVADKYNDQVVKLSANGTELIRAGGFFDPMTLALTLDATSASKYPTATANLSATNVDVGETITFTGTGTDPDGTITLYEWDLDGDGIFEYNSTTSGTTTYSYSTVGIYSPVFRVTDNDWLTATDYSQIVRVGALKTTAEADVTSGPAPLSVNFSGSFVDPLGGLVDNYQWDFDGDNIFDYYSEFSPNTRYTYQEAGTYAATLKVTDGSYTAFDSISINVTSSLPMASASFEYAAEEYPLTVNFTGSGTDLDGIIMLYEWDFTADGTYEWSSVTSGDSSFVYSIPGLYSARFRVTDNDGLTAIADVSVGLFDPVAVANADVVEGHVPLGVNFNANDSNDSDGSIVLYEWNFGDDSPVFSDDMESGTSQWIADSPWGQITTDSHSPATAWTDSPDGNYANNTDVSLTTTSLDLSGVSSATLHFWHHYNTEFGDDIGYVEISTDGGTNWIELASYSGTLSDWTGVQLDLSDYLPNADVRIRFRLTSDYNYTYDGWYLDDVSISPILLNWTTSADGTASHTFTDAGMYTATLRVTDDDGNAVTDTVKITAVPSHLPLATAGAVPFTGTAPLTVNFTGTGTDPDGSITEYHWNFGEEYIWVADNYNNQVVKLALNGTELVRVSGFFSPSDVSANSTDDTVWVTDFLHHRVVKLASDGTELVRVSFSNPSDVSVNPIDGTVWVANSSYDGYVAKLASDGTVLVKVNGFTRPSCVSVNSIDGTVWVANSYNDQVVKLASDGTELLRVDGFYHPNAVSVNPNDHTVWVADTSEMIKLASDGTELVRVSGFSSPWSVSVNPTDDTVWVADTGYNRVIKLASDGTRLLSVNGFARPSDVSVNPTDGTIWVTDKDNNQVVKIASDGTELARLDGFSSPQAVIVAATGSNNYYSSPENGNTNHIYSSPGIYHAIFTVTDNDGNTAQKALDITVYGIPVVAAHADKSEGPAPLEVFFSAMATDTDPTGSIAQYEWDFEGDGTYDSDSTVSGNAHYVYDYVGTFDATVRVTDNDGYTKTDSLTITVIQAPPVAAADAAPREGNVPLTVDFSGSGTDQDGTIALYEWDFEDDGTYDFNSAISGDTTYNYAAPGTYTATLRVTDNDGLSSTDTVTITVNAGGTPSALLYATPIEGMNPLDVEFFLHGIDPDGTITLYEIDFDGDGTYDSSSASPVTAFVDTMENGEVSWTADPPWARVSSDAYSGSYAWTDSPGGEYVDSVDVSLTSTTIDLSAATTPKLIFWHRYDLKFGDYGKVEVSVDGGGSWAELGSFTDAALENWTRQVYDLSSYAGNSTVQVRFRLASNTSETADGWYVDDVWIGDSTTYTYSTHGDYIPTLRITDNDGKQVSISQNIAVFAHENRSFIWVADTWHNQVVKLASDGTELVRVNGFTRPSDVSVNSSDGALWVADTDNNQIVKLGDDGSELVRVNGFSAPKSVSANPTDNSVWVADTDSNQVVKLGDETEPGTELVRASGFSYPSGVSVNLNNSRVWVADTDNDQVVKLDSDGTELVRVNGFYSPSDVSIDPTDDSVWVADTSNGQVVKLDSDGAELLRISGFNEPSSVAMDEAVRDPGPPSGDAAIWVADLDNEQVVKLADDGTELLRISGFWAPWSISVNPTDGTVWIADVSDVVKLADDGTELGRESGFSSSYSVSVNTSDGTAWATDQWRDQVVKLAADGTELIRVGGFDTPSSISVNPSDSTVWVADRYNNQVVKLASDGSEIVRLDGFYGPSAVSVNSVDGSVWVADTSNDQVVKLASDGSEIVRLDGFYGPSAVSINSSDGTVWVADYYQVFKLAADGTELAIGYGFSSPESVSVNPSDGTVWVADSDNNQVVKLSSDGTELFRINGFGFPTSISVGIAEPLPVVEAVWVADSSNNQVVKLATDGTELVRANGFSAPRSVSVNSDDGTVWVADTDNNQVVKLSTDGAEQVRASGFSSPRSVSVNSDDGTVWVADTSNNQAVKLAADGTELVRVSGFVEPRVVLVNSTDGTVWVADYVQDQVVKLAADGTELVRVSGFAEPGALSLNHPDGTLWVADSFNDQVVKLSSDRTEPGTELVRVSGFVEPESVSVNSTDGSVWVADTDNNQVVKLASDGTELVRASGFSSPRSVSVNSADGSVWVADTLRQQLVKLASDGTELKRIDGFDYPINVITNPITGTAWVADRDEDQIVKLASDGTEIVKVNGFDSPRFVSVNPANGTVWVADYSHDQVAKVASNGTELLRINGFNNPSSVAVDTAVRSLIQPPVVNASANPTISINPTSGTLVTFSGSVTDNGTIIKYEWDFEGDGAYDYSSSTTGNTTYTYSSPGTYNPVFRVTDDDGMLGYDASLTINIVALSVEPSASPSAGNAPLNVTLNGNVVAIGTQITAYEWDFEGDGVFDNTSSASPQTTHSYANSGTYTAILRITDSLGNQIYGSTTITVAKSAPSAFNSASPTSGDAPLTVFLSGDGSDPDGTIVLYEWDYNGDGLYDWFSETTADTYFTYVMPDTYTATIRVTDNDGFTSTASQTITVNQGQIAPTVTTTADVTEGAVPLVVNFTGTGNDLDGAIVLYEWDFDGDGMYDYSSETTGNTSYTYVSSGLYNAALRVTDNDNLTATENVLITAKDPGVPTAFVNADSTSGAIPLIVNFDAVGSFDPDGSIELYEWDFDGDGTYDWSSTFNENTRHDYSSAGIFQATVRVTDNDGNRDTDSIFINAGILPESLPMAYPTSGPAPLAVRFSANGYSPNATIEYFNWDFDGNGTIDWTSRISENYTYTYPQPGTYTATQTVIDSRGLSDSESITITVLPAGIPMVEISADLVEGLAPLIIHFIGLSRDEDGFITQYEWDFDGDGVFDYVSSTTATTSHTYADVGTYTAMLRVTDNENNTGNDTVRIEVKESGAPTALVEASPVNGLTPLEITFTGTGMDNGSIVLYEWDFDGDGTYDFSSPTTVTTVHTYSTPGAFNAMLRVTDDIGLTDTAIVEINAAPGIIATLSADFLDPTIGQSININSVLTLDATVSVMIKDRTGNVVRTLVGNAARSAGYYSDIWDGRDHGGQIVGDGIYFYVIEYDIDGNTYTYDITNDVDEGSYLPPVTYPESFNPFAAETNFFRYALATKSEVTIYISSYLIGAGAGDRVKTLLLRKPQQAGSYVMVWDGTDDSGNLVSPGDYVLAVLGWQLPENAIAVMSEPIISDVFVIPTYLNPAARPYDGEDQANLSFTLSKPADVTVSIYDSENYLVRSLTANNIPVGPGKTIFWDGKNDDGKYVAPGTYRLKLIGTANGYNSMPANALIEIFY